MGCGCNKKNEPTSFVWTGTDGAKKTGIRSEIEAKALVIRQGGSYAPAAK